MVRAEDQPGRLGSAGTNFFGIEIAGGKVSTGLLFAASAVRLSFIAFLAYLIFDAKYDKQAAAMAVLAGISTLRRCMPCAAGCAP